MSKNSYVKIEALLDEFEINRNSLKKMVTSIESFKEHMDALLPTSNAKDFRNKWVWEEKMKNIAHILGVELSIRKQIDDSLKNEITLRGKILDDTENDDDDRALTSKLAKMIEEGELILKNEENEE